jgi:hypothetical protein
LAEELERIWKEVVVSQLSYNSGIRMEGLRKITNILSQNIRCSGREQNRGPPEHKSQSLPQDQPIPFLTLILLYNERELNQLKKKQLAVKYPYRP